MLQELHRDFIAAVFDMGLKKADPSRLKGILPKKDRSDPAGRGLSVSMLPSNERYRLCGLTAFVSLRVRLIFSLGSRLRWRLG